MPKSEIIIQAKNLSFAYDSKMVIEDVHFTIKAGQFVGLIGPNGSGKTTLLKLILGLIRPTAGEILVFGQKIHAGQLGATIGYVPQKVTQAESRFPMTVREVVMFGRVARRGLFRNLKPEDNTKAEAALKAVGLWEMRNRLVSDLSGGQQQRVFIAKALAGDPQLLILDEPTVGIDWEAQESFYDLLKRLHEEHGLTILLVSHDIDVVMNEVESVLCLNKKIVCHGGPGVLQDEKCLIGLYGQSHKLVEHSHV